MPNDPVYAAKMVEKRQLAQRHRIRLVELTDADLPAPAADVRTLARTRVPRTELPGDGTTWTWSPATITSPATAARKAQQDAERDCCPRRRRGFGNAGTPRRRTPTTSNARSERLARGQRALELAAAGRTRREIAAELGVSPDAAKELLRDARFYADPATDPARMELVAAATIAREAGRSRAQFAAEQQLTQSKAKETWRDAEIINS